MRGASAPPLSPPLPPRLLCIQNHLPLNQTRLYGSSPANPAGWSRTSGILGSSCGAGWPVWMCADWLRWHLAVRTHLCAPDTAFLCAMLTLREPRGSQRRDFKRRMKISVKFGADYSGRAARRGVTTLFFVFPRHETCSDICAPMHCGWRRGEAERAGLWGLTPPNP